MCLKFFVAVPSFPLRLGRSKSMTHGGRRGSTGPDWTVAAVAVAFFAVLFCFVCLLVFFIPPGNR